MRALSLRFWDHFAYMVISVALLGFGASGTVLTLVRTRIAHGRRTYLAILSFAFAASIPVAILTARCVSIDVQFLVWDVSQIGSVLAIELLMFIPFFFAATMIGVVLMDRPDRLAGHYAANLVGSALGAVVSIAMMHVLSTQGVIEAMAVLAWLAGAILVPWRRPVPAVTAAVAGVIVLLASLAPPSLGMSCYKTLEQIKTWPGTEILYHTEGPLGRIDIAAGPAIHHDPPLSLRYDKPVPAHVLILIDGDQAGAIYDCKHTNDWGFMDYTTAAVAYHVRTEPTTLIIGAGGGIDIGLALFHKASGIVALEMNRQIIDVMTGPLAARGGSIYCRSNVNVINRQARGFLAGTGETFDIIQLPATGPFGRAGAGLYAARESYLYTVDAFTAMLDHLTSDGVLAVTQWARTPPRDGLKIFDTAATALHAKGQDPSQHLAMIRGLSTVTVLVFAQPITSGETQTIRAFADNRLFDLCYLPGLDRAETNRNHILDRPYYFEAANALLGGRREAYLADYVFDIAAATDDAPYFHHFFRWRSLPVLFERLGGLSPAFLETGYLLSVGALFQTVLLALILILLPLAPGIKVIRPTAGKPGTLAFFLLIGLGFMLVEMGFLQKLILYLAHPIYSAAAVIFSFLVFAGIGSQASYYWPGTVKRIAAFGAIAAGALALAYLAWFDHFLKLTQTLPVTLRFLLAAGGIAPLAFAMGHVFPSALRAVRTSAPTLVPWAWAVNGFASVTATVAAPLLALNFGFARVILLAAGCYLAAGLVCHLLPNGQQTDNL